MANFVSTLFSTPQEFEAFLKALDFADKTAIGTINAEKIAKWDNKACYMSVANGKLNLYCSTEETAENLLCSIDICSADNVTTRRDTATGALTVIGWKDSTSGEVYKLWVGTIEAYGALSSKDSKTVYFATNANDAILDLQRRMTAAETDIVYALDHINSAETEIGGLKNRMTTTEGDSANLQRRMTAAETEIDGLQSDLGNAENDISTLKGLTIFGEYTETDHSDNKFYIRDPSGTHYKRLEVGSTYKITVVFASDWIFRTFILDIPTTFYGDNATAVSTFGYGELAIKYKTLPNDSGGYGEFSLVHRTYDNFEAAENSVIPSKAFYVTVRKIAVAASHANAQGISND